ncbi:MAG TPA: FAD-dependent oxidoreductase [Nitrospira sp.]|nr:FAD-dependent oxidoreductase [Nitrospira sp.]
MIVIVGAGLAGLSTAYHLSGLPYQLYEREQEVGGLCRSYRKDGFTFDYTGHLLHFRQAEIKALVESLLAGKLRSHSRQSFIYSHRTYTEYPFQVNTYGLPPEVVRECLMGFIETLTKEPPVRSNDGSFKEWILDNLGEGMAKHFMLPFNEKLWQVSLDELTSDWVSWLVPKPQLKDVINGALGIKDKSFGYNPSFLYPVEDGIRVLPESFLPGINPVINGMELTELDTGRRRAWFSTLHGETREVHYESLVSTIPVPELVRRCRDFPAALKDAAEGLRWVSVYNVNLAVSRDRISDKHWIYFPEPEYPFYRVGFPMNFSHALGREGCSSLYVEISHKPASHRSAEQLVEQACEGLQRAGILRPDDELVVADVKDLRYAYVYFDRHRGKAVPAILAELERRGIHSIGRYGRWEHTSMEDAIAQGRQLAARLRIQFLQQASA